VFGTQNKLTFFFLAKKGGFLEKEVDFLLSRPTNAQHIYINNILYIVNTPEVSIHLHHLQGVLSFYFAKVTKLIRVTNSIKSLD
jgi:hypothetical protein